MRSPVSLSVLCVEDDDDSREMLGVYLRSLGLEVDLVASAEEALRNSQTRDFDLYVLDNWLPDLDGYELCRRLRQRARRSSQIIFFSGAAHEADRQKGIEAGANAYVCKPNFEELMNAIDKFIAKPKVLERSATTRSPEFGLAFQTI